VKQTDETDAYLHNFRIKLHLQSVKDDAVEKTAELCFYDAKLGSNFSHFSSAAL
jgi:hypothetical protein